MLTLCGCALPPARLLALLEAVPCWPRLGSLSLARCPAVGDAALHCVLSRCPRLRSLDATGPMTVP